MQNKIVQLKRQTQQNRYQPRGNNSWDNLRPTQYNQNQRVQTPLNTNNAVDQETLPWCNPCEQPHDQDTCLIAKEAFQ